LLQPLSSQVVENKTHEFDMKFLYEADKLLCLFHQFVGLAAACVDKIDTPKSQNCRAQEGVGEKLL